MADADASNAGVASCTGVLTDRKLSAINSSPPSAWARSGGGGSGPAAIDRNVTYHDLTHYTEACSGSFSMFVEMSYRSLYPDINPHTAGFGDLTAGTKSLLFDCDLMQITFQNKFITPVGNPMKGLGTGHLSIEPSILTSIKVSEHMWLQTQLSQWIPIGGDPVYAGGGSRRRDAPPGLSRHHNFRCAGRAGPHPPRIARTRPPGFAGGTPADAGQ